MKLRPYQQQIINDSRESLKKGNKNIALTISVGAGKSLVAKEILTLAKGKKCAFFSFRVLLIEQIKTYFSCLDGFDITFGTLQKHHKLEEHYDLIIKDELWSHGSKLTTSLSSKFMITLTGTPITSDGYAMDFDDIVEGVQLPDLIELGYAKPIKVLAMPKVNTSNLKAQGAGFNQKQSFELMDKAIVNKDLVKVYKKHCIGRKTLIFGVNIEHCEHIKDEFISNGILADTVHSKKDNTGIIDKYKNNEIEVLINADMLTVGFDEPSINTIIIAKPMKSIPLLIQIVGRATRLNPNKPNDYALVLDCSEAVARCDHHPMDRLNLQKKKTDKNIKKCSCTNPMTLINRDTKVLNEFEYSVASEYKCSACGNIEIVENIKLFDEKLCESCSSVIKGTPIVMNTNDKDIKFVQKCGECDHENITRTILLSNAELKEITTNKIMTGDVSEKQILMMLRAECKKFGYKHQYSLRLYENMQNKNISMQDMKKKIEEISESGKKISMLQFWDGVL